jgi:hypothetical protein
MGKRGPGKPGSYSSTFAELRIEWGVSGAESDYGQ